MPAKKWIIPPLGCGLGVGLSKWITTNYIYNKNRTVIIKIHPLTLLVELHPRFPCPSHLHKCHLNLLKPSSKPPVRITSPGCPFHHAVLFHCTSLGPLSPPHKAAGQCLDPSNASPPSYATTALAFAPLVLNQVAFSFLPSCSVTLEEVLVSRQQWYLHIFLPKTSSLGQIKEVLTVARQLACWMAASWAETAVSVSEDSPHLSIPIHQTCPILHWNGKPTRARIKSFVCILYSSYYNGVNNCSCQIPLWYK